MNTTPTRVRPASPGRSNGQWAVDGHNPLNANEEFKAADNPLNVRARIESTHAAAGHASIPADDLHGRFRWWGLYTQRDQSIDGSRTASLSPEELSGEHFLMRVRLDGGALTTEQLRVVAQISREFARDTADITDRQNLQLHWIDIADVPEIWRRLEAVGLRTTEACGDTPRGILGSPVAGIAADEIIDAGPLIEAIRDRYIGDPDLANLPRKFKTAISGHPSIDVLPEINDISFIGVVHPELGPGWDLWVGGGLSTSPRLGERLGVFVTPDQAIEVWYAAISIFRDYGYRRLRNKARMKFLIADWGLPKFREVLEQYLGYGLAEGIEPVAVGNPDHIGVHEQADGRYYVGLSPVVGRTSGTALLGLADAAEAVGSHRIRLTPLQKLLVIDVPGERVDELVTAVEPLGFSATPSRFRRHTMACTGIEFCKMAFVNTKDTAAHAIAELERRFADSPLDVPVTIAVNGCPNSCVRIQTSDIGLKGQLVKGADGSEQEAFQVHLGGGLTSAERVDPGLGTTLRALKVTSDELPDYLERVIRRFLEQRGADEAFAAWVRRADEEDLR